MLSSPYTHSAYFINMFLFSQKYINFRNLSSCRISFMHTKKMVWNSCSIIFDGNTLVSDTVSILVTIPLMILVIKYMSPYIIRLKYESKKALLLFFMLPLAYYILEYAFTVYTDLLYTGGAVVIDFMDSFIVVFYFILSMLSLKFSDEKIKLNAKICCSRRQLHKLQKK